MKTLLKYFSLYSAMFKASVISDLEYRANFITRFFTDIFWYLSQILTFEVIYNHTNKIGNWGLLEMRVFLGLLFVIDALHMIIFHDNIDQFAEKVRKGDLDLLLVKPVNSQFMISLQKADTPILGNMLFAISWLFYSLHSLPEFNYFKLAWLIILVPCSLVVLYTMRFVFAASSIIFTKADNLQFLWWQIYRIGMRPDSMYFRWIKILILTVVPVGIVVSIPARALLDPTDLRYLLLPLLVSPMLLYFSHLYWKFALRFYASASS